MISVNPVISNTSYTSLEAFIISNELNRKICLLKNSELSKEFRLIKKEKFNT